LLRIEHFPESVDYRMRELEKLLASYGPMHRLDHDASLKLWREIGDVTPLAEPGDHSLWRISTAPSRAPMVMATISAGLKGRWFYDWGGGLVWFATQAGGDCGAAIVRAAVQSGHATLIRAPQSVREDVPVFAPPAAPLMQLTRGIKESFDPHRLFNPGRMYAGL
jgi:glycolate oxidase FAD binding subunit